MKGFLTALGVLAGSYFLIYCSSDTGVMSTDDLSREGQPLVALKDAKSSRCKPARYQPEKQRFGAKFN